MIVKPKIYDRCRAAVRMEPFLWVRGKLRKDGATLNVIAQEVKALRVAENGSPSKTPSHTEDSFAYLSSLREHPPGTKSFG